MKNVSTKVLLKYFYKKKIRENMRFSKTLCVVANLFEFLESRARRRKKRHFAKKAMITPQMSKLLKMKR